MKEDLLSRLSALLNPLTDLSDGLQATGLIVCMHNGDQNRIGPAGTPDRVGIDGAVGLDRNNR